MTLKEAFLFYEMQDDKIDKDIFIKEAIKWEAFPVVKNDKIVAFFVTKENKIHCACLKEYRKNWFPMKLYLKIVKNISNKYGKVVTTTFEETKDFVERLGFKQVDKINNTFIFERYEA